MLKGFWIGYLTGRIELFIVDFIMKKCMNKIVITVTGKFIDSRVAAELLP